jgi:hypothetical protein
MKKLLLIFPLLMTLSILTCFTILVYNECFNEIASLNKIIGICLFSLIGSIIGFTLTVIIYELKH